MSDDSGPNLAVRGIGCLTVLAGLLLISAGYRVRKGTSRLPIPPSMGLYGYGTLILAGVAAVVLGATLVGVAI